MAEKYTSKDLQKWLFDKALEASAPKARKLLLASDQRGREDALIGKLYFFKYDPKVKHIYQSMIDFQWHFLLNHIKMVF